VKKTRSNLEKLLNSGIYLDEDSHLYFTQSDGIYDLSVTELIDKQFKPFNKELVSKWLANNTNKYAHLTPEQIQQQWEEQRDKASRIHREIDMYIKSGKKPILKYAKNGIKWFDNEKIEYGSEYFSELIVYSDDYEIAGTIDLLIYNEEKDGCYIFDWKTTKKIDSRGRNYGIKQATRDIKDSKFNIYELQLSFYRYLLQEVNGIKVLRHYILHLEPSGVNCIGCKYKKDTVKSIINESVDNRNTYMDEVLNDLNGPIKSEEYPHTKPDYSSFQNNYSKSDNDDRGIDRVLNVIVGAFIGGMIGAIVGNFILGFIIGGFIGYFIKD